MISIFLSEGHPIRLISEGEQEGPVWVYYSIMAVRMSDGKKNSRTREDEGSDGEVEVSVKRLRVNADERVDIQPSRPYNRRLPLLDNSQPEKDIDYTQVNLILRELANMREFRSRMKATRSQYHCSQSDRDDTTDLPTDQESEDMTEHF